MVVQMMTGKDLEGSSHSLIEVLTWHLSGRTDENHKNTPVMIPSVPTKL
jgi:hypothetical protein